MASQQPLLGLTPGVSGGAELKDGSLIFPITAVELTNFNVDPARVIVPAVPGVLDTEWVAEITFEGA